MWVLMWGPNVGLNVGPNWGLNVGPNFLSLLCSLRIEVSR